MLISTYTLSQLTHSKHQILSEGDMWSASQYIPQLLQNLQFHERVRNSQRQIPVVSQLQAARIVTI